jgi:hypothetical protein
MSVNSFRPRKFEDFEIVNEQEKVVGHIRVKPSGILWAPSNAKVWYGVSLKDFSEYMESNGKSRTSRHAGVILSEPNPFPLRCGRSRPPPLSMWIDFGFLVCAS